jgi:integrase
MIDDTKGAPSEGAPKKQGRPNTGSLVWTKSGWCARVTMTLDGERVKQWFKLGTANKSVARRKLARLLTETTPAAPELERAETCDEYAVGWKEERKARGIASADYEARFYDRVWSPVIGKKTLSEVTAVDVREVLKDAAAGKILPVKRKHQKAQPKPYSRQSVEHMRATIYRFFQAAWQDEIVRENVVARVSVPEMVETKKPRAVLTDEEIATLLGSPEADAEIKVLLLISRTVGGLRSGDLNVMTWDAFTPGFEICSVVRQKTRKKRALPEPFEVPVGIRPLITAWWERQGRPEGPRPVFPVRRGKRAGEAKKASNMSYADRLRRELWRAGVQRHELHFETSTTRATDFHSVRRGYAQALARIGLNAQEAAKLTGHADLAVHQVYLESAAIRVLPSAAVPYVNPNSAALVANRIKTRRVSKSSGSDSNETTPNLLQPPQIAVGSDLQAGLAQLVEHELPKLGVTGSCPVSRSIS